MDQVELKARELLAAEAEKGGYPETAKAYQEGMLDTNPSMRALVAALSPQWKTIESIPNGQLALFCDMGSAELRNSFFVDWMVDGKFCGNRHHTATHWMPLPEAPND